jgi:hypothetical protein
MPRWASRITLEITDVRVQRLQEISEEDAIAEGCESWSLTAQDIADIQISDDSPDMKEFAALLGPGTMPATAEYRMLWDSLNGKKPMKPANAPYNSRLRWSLASVARQLKALTRRAKDCGSPNVAEYVRDIIDIHLGNHRVTPETRLLLRYLIALEYKIAAY